MTGHLGRSAEAQERNETNLKKIIAILLAALSLSAVFAGCRKEGGLGEDSTSDGADTGSNAKYVADYLPDEDYEGASFKVYTVDPDNTDLTTVFTPDSEANDIVSQAIRKRNGIIEKRYNVVFEQTLADSWLDLSGQFEKLVTSGDYVYDLMMQIQREAFTAVTRGYVTPISKLTYCHTDEPWYATDVNKQFTIAGTQFFAYSDECINMFEQASCVLYNKKILSETKQTDPYDLVKAGTWTYDTFYEQARNAISDTSGDQKVDDSDIMGIVSPADMFYPTVWVSSGLNTIDKGDDDIPVFTASTKENFFNICQKTLDFVKQEGALFDSYHDTSTISASDQHGTISEAIFEGNHALFYVGLIGHIHNYNDMEEDFGVVPAPKYDESQEKYLTRVLDGWIHCVPKTNNELDRTSVIMEALAVETKNYVYEPYYELALKSRYTRDDNGHSAEMLDLMLETRIVDLGDTIWQGISRNAFLDLFWSRDNSFSSTASSRKSAVDKKIAAEVERIKKYNA